jgi:membrane protein DedA with SNARE-associated domain
MSGTLNDLLAQYGYLFIAIFLFVESIGIPIPGETALITAAALAGGGKLNIVGVVVAASFGTITGGMTGYWMGQRGGQAIVLRFGRVLRLDEQRLERARLFFEKHGASALIVGRFIAVVRSFLGIFAGVAAMPERRFAIYNAIGGVIWSLTFSAVGFLFGKNVPAIMRDLGRVSLVLALVLALVILLVVSWRWFTANRARIIAVMETRWQRLDARPWVLGMRQKHPTVWRLFLFRFVRGEYLAMHLVLGWLISVAVLAAFGAITEDVVEGAPLTRSDVAMATRLAAMAGPTLTSALHFLGGIGGPQTVALIVVVVAVFLATRRDWLTLGAWIGGYSGSVALDITLRRIVRRGELPHLPELLPNHLASLPNGHTVEAVLVFGLITHLLILRTASGALRVLLVVVALSLLAAIVAARLFLGSSYLSTESASIASGVIWLAAAISGLELARHRRESIELAEDER